MSIKFTHILLLLGSIVFQTAIVFAQVNTSIQQTALQTLQLNHKKLGFAASDIESPVITDSYTSAGEKVSHVLSGDFGCEPFEIVDRRRLSAKSFKICPEQLIELLLTHRVAQKLVGERALGKHDVLIRR